MQGIVCSRFRVQGQICVHSAGVRAIQPNHKAKLGKRRCIHRLRRSYPNPQRLLFHEFPVSAGLLQVPRLCVRYVRQPLGVLFENQGQ